MGENHSASEIKSNNWNNGDMTQAQHTKLFICHTYTQDKDLHLFLWLKKPPRISTKLHLSLVLFWETECLPKFAMVKRKKKKDTAIATLAKGRYLNPHTEYPNTKVLRSLRWVLVDCITFRRKSRHWDWKSDLWLNCETRSLSLGIHICKLLCLKPLTASSDLQSQHHSFASALGLAAAFTQTLHKEKQFDKLAAAFWVQHCTFLSAQTSATMLAPKHLLRKVQTSSHSGLLCTNLIPMPNYNVLHAAK